MKGTYEESRSVPGITKRAKFEDRFRFDISLGDWDCAL